METQKLSLRFSSFLIIVSLEFLCVHILLRGLDSSSVSAATTYDFICPNGTYSWTEDVHCWSARNSTTDDRGNSASANAFPNNENDTVNILGNSSIVVVKIVNANISVAYINVGAGSEVIVDLNSGLYVYGWLDVNGTLTLTSQEYPTQYALVVRGKLLDWSNIDRLVYLGEAYVNVWYTHSLFIGDIVQKLPDRLNFARGIAQLNFYIAADSANEKERGPHIERPYVGLLRRADIRINKSSQLSFDKLRVVGWLRVVNYNLMVIGTSIIVHPGAMFEYSTGGIFANSSTVSAHEGSWSVINIMPNATLQLNIKLGFKAFFQSVWIVTEGLVSISGGGTMALLGDTTFYQGYRYNDTQDYTLLLDPDNPAPDPERDSDLLLTSTAVTELRDSTIQSRDRLVRLHGGVFRGNGYIDGQVVNRNTSIEVFGPNDNSAVLKLHKYSESCEGNYSRALHFRVFSSSVYDKMIVEESATLCCNVTINIQSEVFKFGPQHNDTFILIETPQVLFCHSYGFKMSYDKNEQDVSNWFSLTAPVPIAQEAMPKVEFVFTGELPNLSVAVKSVNCTNNCSDHGFCDNMTGKCICVASYGGDDCSSIGYTTDRLVKALVTGGFIVFVLCFFSYSWRKAVKGDHHIKRSLIITWIFTFVLVMLLIVLLVLQILVLTRAMGDTDVVFYISDLASLVSAFVGFVLVFI